MDNRQIPPDDLLDMEEMAGKIKENFEYVLKDIDLEEASAVLIMATVDWMCFNLPELWMIEACKNTFTTIFNMRLRCR